MTLSKRQRDLVECFRLGLPNRAIATKLGITLGSVKVYCSHLFSKTGMNRFQLALQDANETIAALREENAALKIRLSNIDAPVVVHGIDSRRIMEQITAHIKRVAPSFAASSDTR